MAEYVQQLKDAKKLKEKEKANKGKGLRGRKRKTSEDQENEDKVSFYKKKLHKFLNFLCSFSQEDAKKPDVKKTKRQVEDKHIDQELFDAIKLQSVEETKPVSGLQQVNNNSVDVRESAVKYVEDMKNDALALAVQCDTTAQAYRRLAQVPIQKIFKFVSTTSFKYGSES